MRMTGSDLRSFACLAVLTLGGCSSGAKSPAGGDGAGGTSGAGGTAGHSSDAGAVDSTGTPDTAGSDGGGAGAIGGKGGAAGSAGGGGSSVDGGGAGGVGGGGHAGSTAGATGSGGGPATIQLGAIPGQDPALVTKAGPPITITGPAFTKPLFDGSVMVTDPAGNIILGYLADALTTTVTKLAPRSQHALDVDPRELPHGFEPSRGGRVRQCLRLRGRRRPNPVRAHACCYRPDSCKWHPRGVQNAWIVDGNKYRG